jgi:hypothetical protein
MSAAQPWMKFYPRDWRADEKLRVCSLASRGLWIEMLALMHGSERYGHLLINGKAPTDAQLAVLAGAPAAEIAALLGELESAGVFSRSATGAIYSRRMTDDERKARTARKNGKHGGNPRLCKETGNRASDNPSDNQQVKGGVKLRGQKADGSVDKSTGVSPADPLKLIFDLGVEILTSQGKTEQEARSIIGKWRKGGHLDGAIAAALVEARTRSISNIVEWMPRRLSGSGSPGGDFLDHYLRETGKAA